MTDFEPEDPPDTSWMKETEIRDPSPPLAIAIFGVTLIFAILTIALILH